MNSMIIEELEKEQLKEAVPEFDIGDTLRISTRIIEGEKERVQVVQGTVIARKGSGLSETFSIHRISYGEGMERVFYLHSPRISNIEVVKRGDVRRAKLYYLRGTSGKAAKVKEKIGRRVKKKPPVAKETLKSESEMSVTESAPEVIENGASS
ncbi:MAG: 50S ribosomal protein L19 [Chlamydiae bacterium]|nr:50S ribosomal protein L19 [Chlamydiota bacterium]